ncbi:hypothetical protein [Providencia alcalifaciens]|uniref:hypothetical protein n=1 Tax=Providencia alcalifaciens TaxID=126385 RepID=UPI001CC3AEBF|nr:hypothetical protein [Providencia alcalifaciens]CAG9428536.1 hypothetical protein NVI2019_GHJFPKLH_02939 [Providencia alcalifaciens]
MQQVMRVLRKLYKYENSQYDGGRAVSTYPLDSLSDKERKILSDSHWLPNEIAFFTDHEDIINKLHSLKQETAITRQRCLDAFVAGVGGSYLRGRSVLGAYHKLHSLPAHQYLEKPQYACCWVCSDHNKHIYINDSYFQYCLYYGNSYTGNVSYTYLNLRHLLTVAAVEPTDEDKKVFNQLLDLLRNAPEDETPGKFEKRLSEAKLIKGDKYTLRGILHSLALIGVIPNTFISLSLDSWHDFGDVTSAENQLNNTKGRSDMEMPWAGWKGNLKIDEEKTANYFGEYLVKR